MFRQLFLRSLGRLLMWLPILALLGAQDHGGTPLRLDDPSAILVQLAQEHPFLLRDGDLDVRELGEVEYDARIRLLTSGEDPVSEVRDIRLLRAIAQLEGRDADWRRMSGFLSGSQREALSTVVATQLDANEFDPERVRASADWRARTKLLAAFADGPPPDHPPAGPFALGDVTRSLLDAMGHEADDLQESLERLPPRRRAEYGAALRAQAASLDQRDAVLTRALGLVDDTVRNTGRAAFEFPTVAMIASSPVPSEALRDAVPTLLWTELNGGLLDGARATVQLDTLAEALGLGESRIGLLRLLSHDQLKLLAARVAIAQDAAEAAPDGPDPAITRVRTSLEERRQAINTALASSSGRPPRGPTLAEKALLERAHHEVHAHPLEMTEDDLDIRTFRALLDCLTTAELERWRDRLGDQIRILDDALVQAGRADLGSRREKLLARADEIRDALRQRTHLPDDADERLEKLASALESLQKKYFDCVEARLVNQPSTTEAVDRARVLAALSPHSPKAGSKEPTTPKRPPEAGPPSPPGFRPPPRGPVPPAPSGGAVPTPKGVKLGGSVVLVGSLDIAGAGFDPETGAIYLVTEDATLPLELGDDLVGDEGAARRLMMEVYRSVYVDGYSTLYLSIDPLEPARELDADLRGHATLRSSVRERDCKPHCHNEVVTDGGIADTLVGRTLYEADIFFKEMMLGVDLATGKPKNLGIPGYESPFDTWTRDVARQQSGRATVADREAAIAAYREHWDDTSRWCRVWFDMVDMEVSAGEAGGIAFGKSPVFAHAEAMRVVNGALRSNPRGSCPDAEKATRFINRNWTKLRSRYPELGRLDFIARLVAFFNWARDLREDGLEVDFDAIDRAWEEEPPAPLATPRFTSGIAREFEKLSFSTRNQSARLMWQDTSDGLLVISLGSATAKLADTLQRAINASGGFPAACDAYIADRTPANYAACANASGLTSSRLRSAMTAAGVSVERVVGADPAPFCASGRINVPDSVPDGAIPRKPFRCLGMKGDVEHPFTYGGNVSYHGGVEVGGFHERKQANSAAKVEAAWATGDRSRTAVIGHGTVVSRTVESHTRGDLIRWSVQGNHLVGEARDATGLLVERRELQAPAIAEGSGPAGWIVTAGGAEEARREWWIDRGVCRDHVTRLAEGAPRIERCLSRREQRRQGDAPGWESPPGVLEVRRVGSTAFVEGRGSPRATPDFPRETATAHEWMRWGWARLREGDWSLAETAMAMGVARAWDASVGDQPYDLLGFARRMDESGSTAERAGRWLAEVRLGRTRFDAARAAMYAGDDVGGVALSWEAEDLAGGHARVEVPRACAAGAEATSAAMAEGCARVWALRASRGASEDDRVAARTWCASAGVQTRCESLVGVIAGDIAECATSDDPRVVWRCASRTRESLGALSEDALVAGLIYARTRAAPEWWDLLLAEGEARIERLQ